MGVIIIGMGIGSGYYRVSGRQWDLFLLFTRPLLPLSLIFLCYIFVCHLEMLSNSMMYIWYIGDYAMLYFWGLISWWVARTLFYEIPYFTHCWSQFAWHDQIHCGYLSYLRMLRLWTNLKPWISRLKKLVSGVDGGLITHFTAFWPYYYI